MTTSCLLHSLTRIDACSGNAARGSQNVRADLEILECNAAYHMQKPLSPKLVTRGGKLAATKHRSAGAGTGVGPNRVTNQHILL